MTSCNGSCNPAPRCRRRGSTIAGIVGHNVLASRRFDATVNMWVYEEEVGGRKLTEIINTEHENVKYLPGHKLPSNVVRGGGGTPRPDWAILHYLFCFMLKK